MHRCKEVRMIHLSWLRRTTESTITTALPKQRYCRQTAPLPRDIPKRFWLSPTQRQWPPGAADLLTQTWLSISSSRRDCLLLQPNSPFKRLTPNHRIQMIVSLGFWSNKWLPLWPEIPTSRQLSRRPSPGEYSTRSCQRTGEKKNWKITLAPPFFTKITCAPLASGENAIL